MANHRQVAVAEEVSIEVVEGSVDTLRVDDEVGPRFDESLQELEALVVAQVW